MEFLTIRRRDDFVSRLISRVGIRAIAVGVLLSGAVGGAALGFDRNTQQRVSAAGFDSQAQQVEMQQLKSDVREYNKVTAQQREAQRIADDKAAAEAKVAAAKAAAADAAARAKQSASRSQDRTSQPAPTFGPIPSSCSQYSGNQAIGCTLMLQWGFALSQMPCLVNMWNKESGWRTSAANPSGAYGIPQALPGNKMAVYGSDWQTNPATQIKWGLDYIKNRYSTPCGAWTYWQSHGWY